MKRFILKRKLVKIESIAFDAETFEDAQKRLRGFLSEVIPDDVFIEGVGTIEYIGDAE